MKLKIDENLPAELAALLRGAGHDALTVRDEMLNGAPDDEILAVCQQEGRVLITLDMGFANIVAYPPDQSPGFIVLRPRSQDRVHLAELVQRIIPFLSSEPIAGRLWIVDENRIRIRRPDPEFKG